MRNIFKKLHKKILTQSFLTLESLLMILFSVLSYPVLADGENVAFLNDSDQEVSFSSLSAPRDFEDALNVRLAEVGIKSSDEWLPIWKSNLRIVFLKNPNDSKFLGPIEKTAFETLAEFDEETLLSKVIGTVETENLAVRTLFIFFFRERFSMNESDFNCMAVEYTMASLVGGRFRLYANIPPENCS